MFEGLKHVRNEIGHTYVATVFSYDVWGESHSGEFCCSGEYVDLLFMHHYTELFDA